MSRKASQRLCIIGDGGWGTTLAALLSKKGVDVAIWGIFPDYIEVMKDKRENVKFLPGVAIPHEVRITASLDEALKGSDIVILAAPSQYARSILMRLKTHDMAGKAMVSVVKGIETKTLMSTSAVIRDVMGTLPVAVMSGPTIALEVAHGVPTSAVVASTKRELANSVRDLFMTDRFRVYTNSDVLGVELGGSLKNIIAIAAGVCDGMGFGANSKAALLTRGLVEIVRLGVAMGAKRDTFYGLSGLGDLTTTCVSQHSRNRWFGEEIGRGKHPKEIVKETEMVVEGVATAKAGYALSKRHRVDMPITHEIYSVLYEGKDPKRAVHDLMTRAPKAEGKT